MIRVGNVIRHRRALDVVFRVDKVFNVGHKLKIKGHWINMGFVKSWVIDRANITIETKDLGNWSRAQFNDSECFRYEGFRRIA
jgi:hypothetical protein